MSSKSPTIRRILKEAAELNSSPSPDYHAAPLESDLFEWHFTLRGAPAPSPYEGGLYHGRIVLPPAYPYKPPSFRFTTPTGRFEVNREICLSISGHHEETWQPAWGIRTALVAIRSFMDTDAKGQIGGMDASESARKRFALQSSAWKCAVCGKTNAMIMKEHEETVSAAGDDATTSKESVPEELRLAYRDQLNGEAQSSDSKQVESVAGNEVSQASPPQPPSSDTARSMPVTVQQAASAEEIPGWIDKAIYAVIGIIMAFLYLRYAL